MKDEDDVRPNRDRYDSFVGPTEAERTVAMQQYRRNKGWSKPGSSLQAGGQLGWSTHRMLKHKPRYE